MTQHLQRDVPDLAPPGARWWAALKPGSWPKLVVPALFGQALGAATGRGVSAAALAVGGLYTLGLLGFIVLLNDWGDREVDAIKRRMFPAGCSPKTIPDGLLTARQVLLAGLGAGAVALVVAAAGGALLGRPLLFAAGAGCLALFLCYTFPPVKLNYRGGGELLEAAGVGVALPWWNALAQGCASWHPLLVVLGGSALTALSSALASGLSDEESDRAGGKRTLVTTLGNAPARRLAEVGLGLGGAAWVAAAAVLPGVVVWWAILPAVAVLLGFGARAHRLSPGAVTNAFPAQGAYKRELHRAIWGSHLVLGALLLVAAWR
jgi:4-hydroxybenzoate polyprenyltransferase